MTGQIRRLKRKSSKRRELPAEGALGLVLVWYRTRGSVARGLQHFFGMTGTQIYKWLRFSRRVLLYVYCKSKYLKVLSRNHPVKKSKYMQEQSVNCTQFFMNRKSGEQLTGSNSQFKGIAVTSSKTGITMAGIMAIMSIPFLFFRLMVKFEFVALTLLGPGLTALFPIMVSTMP